MGWSFFELQVSIERDKPGRRAEAVNLKKLNVFLLILLAILAMSIPRFVLYRNEVMDPFSFRNGAYVQKNLASGHLVPAPSNDTYRDVDFHPAIETMIGVISLISGDAPSDVLRYPVGSLILIPIFFVLSRRLIPSSYFALALTMFLAYEVSLIDTAGVFTAAWGFPLFLSFVFLYGEVQKAKKVVYLLPIILVFGAAHLYYYTAEVWMIVFSAVVNVLLLVRKFQESGAAKQRYARRLTLNATLTFAVIFLAFNRIIYEQFLPTAEVTNVPRSASIFLSSLLQFLPTSSPLEPYTVSEVNGTLFVLNLMFSLVVALPVLIYALVGIVKIVAYRSRVPDSPGTQFVTAALANSAVDVGEYTSYGVVSFKSVLLREIVFVYPLAAFVAITHLTRSHKVWVVFTVLVLALTVFRFGLSVNQLDTLNPPRFSDTQASADWLSSHGLDGPRVLSDFDTVGLYQVHFSANGKGMVAVEYDSTLYGTIVSSSGAANSSGLSTRTDYYMVDISHESHRISGLAWKYYEPISKHATDIAMNDHLIRVYDDGRDAVFAVTLGGS